MTAPITADTELITPAEAAAILRVRPPTIRKYINTGVLPAIRITQSAKSDLRIRRTDFDAWVETLWITKPNEK